MRQILAALVAGVIACTAMGTSAQQQNAAKPWKAVAFAIVRYNDDAPKSWNLYHSDKRGVLLLRLWKRYLLLNVPEQEVYDIDPQKVKVNGESVELSDADVPDSPVDTTDWKIRDVGPMQRVRFRFGEKGNYLDVQIPLRADGKPSY